MKVFLLIFAIQFQTAVFAFNESPFKETDKINSRIIQGTNKTVNPGYIAYLSIDGGTKICGGVLITKDYVLTAANCLYQASSVTVTLNVTDLKNTHENPVVIPGKKMIIHEDYGTGSGASIYAYDIALIELSKSVVVGKNNISVAIPATGANKPPSKLTLWGWGKTANSAGYSNILLNASAQISTAEKCNELFGNKKIVDDNVMLCTVGAKHEGACLGDNGGPLVDIKSNILYGIISLFHDDCEHGYPTVYTKLSAFDIESWIMENSDYRTTTTTTTTIKQGLI